MVAKVDLFPGVSCMPGDAGTNGAKSKPFSKELEFARPNNNGMGNAYNIGDARRGFSD